MGKIDKEVARQLRAEGWSLAKIGARFGVTASAVAYSLDYVPVDRALLKSGRKETVVLPIVEALTIAGLSAREIGKRIGLGVATVQRFRSQIGCTKTQKVKHKKAHADAEAICLAYAKGQTLQQLAASYSMSVYMVRRILQDNDVCMRPGGPKRTGDADEQV